MTTITLKVWDPQREREKETERETERERAAHGLQDFLSTLQIAWWGQAWDGTAGAGTSIQEVTIIKVWAFNTVSQRWRQEKLCVFVHTCLYFTVTAIWVSCGNFPKPAREKPHSGVYARVCHYLVWSTVDVSSSPSPFLPKLPSDHTSKLTITHEQNLQQI